MPTQAHNAMIFFCTSYFLLYVDIIISYKLYEREIEIN